MIQHSELKDQTYLGGRGALPMISAQIILSFDGTSLLAEISGPSGSRRKVEVSFSDLPLSLREALDTSLTQQRDRQKAALREQQGRNIQYVAQQRGMGLSFAKQIWAAADISAAAEAGLNFSYAAKRLHNTDAAPLEATAGATAGAKTKLSREVKGKTLEELGL